MRPFTRIVPLALLTLLTAFLVSACSDDEPTAPAEEKPSVRLMHFRHDGPNYDLKMEYAPLTSNTAFARSSGYALTEQGNKLLSVFVAGTNDTVRESRAYMNAGKFYSLYMMGMSDTTEEAVFVPDSITDLNAGYTRLKVAHMSPDGPKFDVKIRTSNSAAKWTRVEYGRVTFGIDMTPGVYEIVLTEPGTNKTFRSFDGVSLSAGTAFTMVVYGTMRESDGTDFGARLFEDNASGASVEMVRSWQKATIHVLQGVEGLDPVTVTVDDTVKLASLAYSNNDVVLAPTGDRTLKFSAGGTDYVNHSISVEGYRVYTMILHGIPAQYFPLWKEETVQPNPAIPLVRFYNLSLDAGAVDVVSNIGASPYPVPGMQGIGYAKSSASPSEPWREFLNFPGSAPHMFEFKIRKTGTETILIEDTYEFLPGSVTTVYLTGSATAGTLKLSLMTF